WRRSRHARESVCRESWCDAPLPFRSFLSACRVPQAALCSALHRETAYLFRKLGASWRTQFEAGGAFGVASVLQSGLDRLVRQSTPRRIDIPANRENGLRLLPR